MLACFVPGTDPGTLLHCHFLCRVHRLQAQLANEQPAAERPRQQQQQATPLDREQAPFQAAAGAGGGAPPSSGSNTARSGRRATASVDSELRFSITASAQPPGLCHLQAAWLHSPRALL